MPSHHSVPCHRSLLTHASPLLFPRSFSPRRRHATMPPCWREIWGYRGVRARPSGGFSAEIRFRGMHLGLRTFDTAHEAARAYNAATWHLQWPHRTLSFPNVPTRERAQELMPLSRLITDEDHRDNRRREHCLGWTRKPWRYGANASRRTSSTSASSTRKGGQRGRRGGRSKPHIVRTSVCGRRPLNSTSS